ncbi:hypothetical protein CBS101457_004618 [Exobasidium rhododendri]|nr:hypothetical protein CBS101457_004618 [Exobasidium rhododendri]
MSGDSFLTTLAAYRLQLDSSKDHTEDHHTDVLSSPLLSSPLVSSSHFDKLVESSATSIREARQGLQAKQTSLLGNIDTYLSSFSQRKSDLLLVPEEIEATEDTLMDLCSRLSATEASSSVDKTSTTLLVALESQMQALQQLYTARDYLSLLAKAEDLQKKAAKAEDADQSTESLELLTELSSLAKSTQSLASPNDVNGGLKAMEFLRSQKSRAFSHLVFLRKERLSTALKKEGWPPAPAELEVTAAAKEASRSAYKILTTSSELRKRWKDLMKLQRRCEKLQILPACSAQIHSSNEPSKDAPLIQPGSDEYQPLLAVQCLLTPLLLRFYYHFDSSRSTNRLDKPEWYLAHMLNLVRSHAQLFEPHRGPIAILCSNKSSRTSTGIKYNLYGELLHGILRPLVQKIESSIPLLLENSQLLSHTIMQVVQFDQDLRSLLPEAGLSSSVYLSERLLSKESVFEAWVQSERDFATLRLEEEMESGGAWLVGEEEEIEEEGQEGSWAAMVQEGSGDSQSSSVEDSASGVRMKTTRSARAVMGLLDGLAIRYRGLSSLHHQLPFLLIQLSVLQNYAKRLETSLDSFESMSSAFTRVIPGAISLVGSSPGPDVGLNSEGDMVRGLRGLGRLLKACLSALFVSKHLNYLSSTSFYLEVGLQLQSSQEGRKALKEFQRWQENENDEKELDKVSLGELVRRGWRSGGKLASGVRPLGANVGATPPALIEHASSAEIGSTAITIDVWAESKNRFDSIIMRAQKAMEKLVVSEVMESSRKYSQRSWDDAEVDGMGNEEEEEEELGEATTPSLLPSLSLLSNHLSHLIPSLPKVNSNFVYRSIANSLSTSLVDRVVIIGGSHRFSERGAQRFRQDVLQGWMGVIGDIASTESRRTSRLGTYAVTTAMGRRPEAPWKYLLDASLLLSLPSQADGSENVKEEEGRPITSITLHEACKAAFQQIGPTWNSTRQQLEVDDRIDVRIVQEILRRRIDCQW